MKCWCVIVLASVGVTLAQTGSPAAMAIRNARIYSGNGPVIAKGTVVVRNGLIEAAGENVSIPADAFVIEGEGLHVYPGLIDALATWGMPPPEPPPAPPKPAPAAPGAPPAPAEPKIQYLYDSGPEQRPSNSSWQVAADTFNPSDKNIAAARSNGFTTAVVFPTANIFAGQGSAINLAGEKSGQMTVGQPVGQYVTVSQRGLTFYPGSLMGVISYIRQIYIDAENYKESQKMYSENAKGLKRPAYDRALDGVVASPRILLPASRVVEMDRMIRFGKELKQPFVLYGGTEAYAAADLLKQAGVPVLVSLKWPEKEKDTDPEAKEPLKVLEVRDKAPSGPAALAKAGVPFAFFSMGIEKPSDIRKSVQKAIEAGLSKEDALKAMTLAPAQIYQLDDRLGSIEPGKIANLTVTDGELFEEKSKIKFVVIDGAKHEPVPEVAPAKPGATE